MKGEVKEKNNWEKRAKMNKHLVKEDNQIDKQQISWICRLKPKRDTTRNLREQRKLTEKFQSH